MFLKLSEWNFKTSRVKYERKGLGIFVILYFCTWGILTNGVFVFLPTLLVGFLMYPDSRALVYAFWVWVMSFGFSSVVVLPDYFTDPKVDIGPQVNAFLTGSYIAGVIGSIALLLTSWGLKLTHNIELAPLQWAAILAAYSVAMGLAVMVLNKLYEGLKCLREVIVY